MGGAGVDLALLIKRWRLAAGARELAPKPRAAGIGPVRFLPPLSSSRRSPRRQTQNAKKPALWKSDSYFGVNEKSRTYLRRSECPPTR